MTIQAIRVSDKAVVKGVQGPVDLDVMKIE